MEPFPSDFARETRYLDPHRNYRLKTALTSAALVIESKNFFGNLAQLEAETWGLPPMTTDKF